MPGSAFRFPQLLASLGVRACLPWCLLAAAGGLAFFLYRLGFVASWTFDDPLTLRGLAQVSDLGSALSFVFGWSGTGYPGRPLALASFLLNADDWPGNPAGFRLVNALLHIGNGLLVALLARKVAVAVPHLASRANGFAVTLAALWLLHPFLASTSLFAVQRMTLLAACFTLLGLLAYLHGRRWLATHPVKGYAWMSSGLIGFGLLGYFSKENGALLPILAGVLELTVLSLYAPLRQRYWTVWRILFFAGPLLLLCGYAIWNWGGMLDSYAYYRSFSMGDRLASQGLILVDYLRQILVPDIGRMGPMQDDTSYLRPMGPLTLAVCLAWLGAAAAAVYWRKRIPALSFAVLFFLAGHLLESTIFPLELYFEHRNYLPSLGPLAGLVALLWSYQPIWRWLSMGLVAVAGLLLWTVTSTWGQPLLAAHVWATAHPTSNRAAQHLTNMYLLGQDYQAAANFITTRFRAAPHDHSLGIQALYLQCFVADSAGYTRLLAEVTHHAAGPYFGTAIFADSLSLITSFRQGKCPHATSADLRRLVQTYLDNPHYQQYPSPMSALHIRMAMLHIHDGELGPAVSAYREAMRLEPSPALARDVVEWLAGSGHADEAASYYHFALAQLQKSPLPKVGWQSKMEVLHDRLTQAIGRPQHHPAGP